MSSLHYIEVDSNYRDRTNFPNPAYFEIPLSQTGRKGPYDALDPVSLSAPIAYWTSNLIDALSPGNVVSGTISSISSPDNIAATSDNGNFMITAAAGTLQQKHNYYQALNIVNTTINATRRIVSYQYLGSDSSGDDRAQITVANNFGDALNLGDSWTINDPTDLSDTSEPLFFVPSGRFGSGSYGTMILYNETVNQSRPILDYDFVTHIVSLDTSSSNGGPVAGWSVTDNYCIRGSSPTFVTTVGAGTTATNIVITAGSNTNNFYNGSFIRIRAAQYGNAVVPPETQYGRIVSYNGSTQTATISQPFSVVPSVGQVIEILPFSFDNLSPLGYSGSTVSQQENVCYQIQLLDLVLPNQTILSTFGSRITFYQYVYVLFRNVSSGGTSNILYSNNPNSTKILFRASVDDVPNPVNSTFLKIDSDGSTQSIKFKPNDNLVFGVYLSSGELFETVIKDNVSPLPPNEMIQISALFSIKRVT
jgi:hypothetical protein